MLVEPSPILRLRLHEWLESVFSGRSIFIAANGHDALRLAEQEQPSHILIDMTLPDTTSFEIIRQMRQGLPTAKIITAGWYDSRFFLDNVRSAGADGLIRKDKLVGDFLPLWEILIE